MVNIVRGLRQSRVSMAWVGMQGLYRMARQPRIYSSDIQSHASNTAVIVVDGINGFLHKHGSLFMQKVADIFPRMNKVINAARAESLPVLYFNDNHKADDVELKNWPKHAPKWSWETLIHCQISQPLRRQEIFKKGQFSAFRQGVLAKETITAIFGEDSTASEDFFVALDKGTDTEVFLFKPGVADKIREAVTDSAKQKKILALLKHYEKVNPHARLQKLGTKKLLVLGVATEYCDEANSVDGVKLGYEVIVAHDSIRAVDLTPGDGDRAVYRMFKAGVRFLDTFKVVDQISRREHEMPLAITPTDFPIGPSVVENARPIVTEDMAGNQAKFTASLNYRRDPLPAWLTQTDLYQLVMANLFFQACRGNTPVAHFEAFVRRYPVGRDFMVLSGLHDFLHWMKNARMDEARIDYVLSRPIIRDSVSDLDAFADYLRTFKFQLDVWSYPEGNFFAPLAPFVGMSGPVEQILMAETYFLSMKNSRSAFSTRAAQYRLANPNIATIAMEMRRMDAALSEVASFEAWLQGFVGTSNAEAGFQYGIDSIGTNSHAMYLAFDKEIEAIRTWFDIYPNYPMVLTETFHVLINALKTASVMQERGSTSTAFRVDSGKLIEAMNLYERILKQKGFDTSTRVGTNDIVPLMLAEMQEQMSNANAAGVGTKFGEVPATPAVLKLSEIDGPGGSRFICKISSGGKASLPGIHQVWRRFDSDGHAVEDVVALLDERVEGATPLMVPFTSGGFLLSEYPGKDELRAQYELGRSQLPRQIIEGRGLGTSGFEYPVGFTDRTLALREQVVRDIRAREIDPYLAELANYATADEIEGLGL